jgi:uncharacterized protein YnzC (UPF0291/DUF896 family)
MEQQKIDRISELSRKARTPQGLTAEEQRERQSLRQEYLEAVRGNLQAQLEHIVVVDAQGNRRKLEQREESGK